ncbi:MAG TPA: response regulator transcription factor [Acidimicrobiia bacterium]|jgi:DNA-binding CsgD family transcriptional regulator/tetratricopeptide (TPR) repeat protein|nr:response regulator transcription factor [Acidimicrobiia bacterium]
MDRLEEARAAADRGDWARAYEYFSAADATDHSLDLADIPLFADTAFFVGKTDEALELYQRAHQRYLDAGDLAQAIRQAFWLVLHNVNRGDFAQGGGWLARGQRLVEGLDEGTIERAYMLVPVAFRQVVFEHDFQGGYEKARTVAELARRFSDANLFALALNVQGRCQLLAGETKEGLGLLDEAMVTVLSGGVSALVAGIVYCSLISACFDISELKRAEEWTEALTRWCDRQQGMVAFTGECRVRRAAIAQLRGDWKAAEEEARLGREKAELAADRYMTGLAIYQEAEIQRLRGEYESAEAGYQAASSWGVEPQPGLSLLRLGQGRVEKAAASIRRILLEVMDPVHRARLLPAAVEIMIEAGDLTSARSAAEELHALALAIPTPGLEATAEQSRGWVLLSEERFTESLAPLGQATKLWGELGAPYEQARVKVLLANAYARVGDDDAAAMNLSAATGTFTGLGATPDLRRMPLKTGSRSHGLTPREVEVIRLLATGMTNQAIADQLYLSVRTVNRHVSNIFSKLRVSSRAAATAYALRNDLA